MNDQKNKAMNGHHVNHNNNRLNVMNQNHTSSSGGNNLSKNSLQQQQSQNNSKNGCNGSTIDMSHVKKPLNAFMLFMREQRSKVVAEHMLKESAAINQILGKMVRHRRYITTCLVTRSTSIHFLLLFAPDFLPFQGQ